MTITVHYVWQLHYLYCSDIAPHGSPSCVHSDSIRCPAIGDDHDDLLFVYLIWFHLFLFYHMLWDIYSFVSVCQTVQTLITIERWIVMRRWLSSQQQWNFTFPTPPRNFGPLLSITNNPLYLQVGSFNYDNTKMIYRSEDVFDKDSLSTLSSLWSAGLTIFLLCPTPQRVF